MSFFIDPRSTEWNYVVVAGLPSPGRAEFTNVKAPYIFDVQPAFGAEGAVMIFRGRGIARPKLTLTFWLPEHFLQWAFFVKFLEPPTPIKPLVIEMRHPALTYAGIKAVAVEAIGAPKKQPSGVWTVEIDLIEWRPLKPAIVKPRGAIPSPDKGAPITPQTEAQRAVVELNARFEAARAAAR